MNKNTLLLLSGGFLTAAFLVWCSCGSSAPSSQKKKALAGAPVSVPGWPAGVRAVKITSSYDSTSQPALFWAPGDSRKPRPLLVALHTWSGDYLQSASIPYWQWCSENGWVFIHPDFRGPNSNELAGGSLAATADILDAVAFCRENAPVDTGRIYLVGASGGGHMALLTLGRAPGLWAAVSAWVPITDLAAWHAQCLERRDESRRYAADLEAICGGPPGQSQQVDRQYYLRSPLSVLGRAGGVPVDINAGIHDGHTGSVPVSHSLKAFNALAKADGSLSYIQLTQTQIDYFVTHETAPPELVKQFVDDTTYGDNYILFRRCAGQVRLTIFEGSHEIITGAAMRWLAGQRKGGP